MLENVFIIINIIINNCFIINNVIFFQFLSRSCKSDTTTKSMSRFPSSRTNSKWQRTVGGGLSTLQNDIQSPVEDAEVFILSET